MAQWDIRREDGTLEKEYANTKEIKDITGIGFKAVAFYTQNGKLHHSKEKGNFYLEYSGVDISKKPDEKFRSDWNEVRFKLNPNARVEDEVQVKRL